MTVRKHMKKMNHTLASAQDRSPLKHEAFPLSEPWFRRA